MLRYGVTLLACLIVAGSALRLDRPAPPGALSPVELIDRTGDSGDDGKRRASPVPRSENRRVRQGPRGRRKSEDGHATARRRRDRTVAPRLAVASGPGFAAQAPAVRSVTGVAVVVERDDDDGDDAAGEGRSAARGADD